MSNVDKQLADLEQQVAYGGDGTAMLRDFVRMDNERKDLEAKLKSIKTKLDELQGPIREWFVQTGTDSIRIDDRLVHMVGRFKVTPKPGFDKMHIVAALKNSGNDDLVEETYHWSRLASLAREYDESDLELPEELLEVAEIGKQFRVQTRK